MRITLPPELENQLESFSYSEYSEYRLHGLVPAEYIRRSKCQAGREKAMQDLCISYIYTLGNLCKNIAGFHDRFPDDEGKK